ncbi:MAG TPA: GIY-YIG nuclease family protein [Sphingopyxis sp.]|jgi:predicted GIY-YIG superfamily endonuclease|uniref:GIY-YIG nuclease family protein n=1 Tax=Sphingopyxis sp. TaxID=1908224 RepID=UPI002E14C279|nr:GIY-YIG nuclease family protein [Sphingopyxis sp.]
MSFWAYILHCRGGVFYTGHTDNLPRRIAEHETGVIVGFTSDKLPVPLSGAKSSRRGWKPWKPNAE